MKYIIRKSLAAFLLTATLGSFIAANTTRAQNVETTSVVTSAGTISQFGPEDFVVKSQDSSAPMNYSYSKTTTYVDENGQPVSVETVKSGVPVTVYYTKDGTKLVATKVIVRKAGAIVPTVPVPTPIVETKTTTTTTTNN
jgi:hypothetical protein